MSWMRLLFSLIISVLTSVTPFISLPSLVSLVSVYKHEIATRERDPNDEGEIEIKTIDNREISTQIKGFSTCTDYMFYSVDGFRVTHNIQTGRLVPQVGVSLSKECVVVVLVLNGVIQDF